MLNRIIIFLYSDSIELKREREPNEMPSKADTYI